MKYIAFERQLSPFKIFSIDDIRKKAPGFDTRRLVEWQHNDYIEKIVNRWYLFADVELSERLLFLIANRIYAPSYISFESALSWHGLIPEGVFSITSATSKKTKTFYTPQGTFIYHHLKPQLHFGYRLERIENQVYKMAELEKVLLDYLYLHSEMKAVEDFEAWRINTDQLNRELDREKLQKYLSLFSNKALNERVERLLKYVEDVES
jgi:predicted transcriptional regulator of viral defense system